MEKEDYYEILDVSLKVSIRNVKLKHDWSFILDTDPKYISKWIQKYLQEKNVKDFPLAFTDS